MLAFLLIYPHTIIMNKEQQFNSPKLIDIPGDRWVEIAKDGSRTILDSNFEKIHRPTGPTVTELGSAAFVLVDQTPLYYRESPTAA